VVRLDLNPSTFEIAGMNKTGLLHVNDTFAMRLFGSPEPAMRVICFPFAAGHSNCFEPMAQYIPDDWQLCAIDPPGHGAARGSLLLNMDEAISLYAEQMQPWFRCRFCIFGHSLGGIVGFLLTLELEKRGNRPEALFVSATSPPHRIIEKAETELASGGDDYILELLTQIDEEYESLCKNSFFFFYQPLYRADYRMLESLKLDCISAVETDLYVFYSAEDSLVDWKRMAEWQEYGRHTQLLKLDGKHNYVLTHPKLVVDNIVKQFIPSDGA
jgi:surfactin synthase thioesterase subunit